MIETKYTIEELKSFMEMPIHESYVKLELLDWNENFIQEIQGIVTNGSVSFNGQSAMRRTCNFTLLIPDMQNDYVLSNIINLNKKFRLYIGYKNHLNNNEEIIWFKLGVYVFITASFNHSTSGTSISVTARDKMCLLNGQIQGQIPESIILHSRETYVYDSNIYKEVEFQYLKQINKDENDKEYIVINGEKHYIQKTLLLNLIREIIYEVVSHYGKENKSNIYINDVPDYGRLLVKYLGVPQLYLEKDINGDYKETQNNLHIPPSADQMKNFQIFSQGDLIGYKITRFVYPGELISNVGESVTSILDKICTTFGNFEYFYDVDGHFIFQEKKNYLNNTFIPLIGADSQELFDININKNQISYSFKENKIISAFTNNPKWENIKNDFVVWGKRTTATGQELPIHFHLAIDTVPQNQNGIDYRQIILNNDEIVGESAASDYYKELKAFWPQIYEQHSFKQIYQQDPTTLPYWLEIYPADGKYAKYSVPAIGRRTYAIEDENATCVYPPEVPGIVWCEDDSPFFQDRETISNSYFNGYPVVKINSLLNSAIVAAEDRKSCYEVIRELLYQKLSLQETITIQCLPVYWLEPGDMIEVEDSRSNIYGNYIITAMSLPLAYNGLMSITAIRADSRI